MGLLGGFGGLNRKVAIVDHVVDVRASVALVGGVGLGDGVLQRGDGDSLAVGRSQCVGNALPAKMVCHCAGPGVVGRALFGYVYKGGAVKLCHGKYLLGCWWGAPLPQPQLHYRLADVKLPIPF